MATCVETPSPCNGELHAAPASRASWCGQLRVGKELCVPVKAYAAIATPPDTPLHQLHSTCGQRIEYRKWCPQHGAVPPEEIVKGYPYQPGQHVRISPAELEQLQPSDDKTIHLRNFVDPGLINLVLLAGRSLYLAPANPAAHRPFATLQHALRQSGKWGVGLVVFSGKQQTIVVRPEDRLLMIHTLHHPALRRALPGTEADALEVAARDVTPLRRLIDSMSGAVSWDALRDDVDRRLAELVEAKVQPAKRRSPSVKGGRRTKAKPQKQTTKGKRRQAA